MEEEDLDTLKIMNPSDRGKIMTAVQLLREFASEEEIPPIIIPTYSSSAGPTDLLEDVQDHLNHILEPPPNFTRTGNGKVVRDSGVFLKFEEEDSNYHSRRKSQEQEDPEIEEIILSPINLPLTSMTLNPSDSHLMLSSRMSKCVKGTDPSSKGYPSIEEHYDRERFLHAKSVFESPESNPSMKSPLTQTQRSSSSENSKNQFIYCEKSSDSGISLGANSPPPNRYE